MKVFKNAYPTDLVPEVDLCDLFHVEGLVHEGRHVQVSPGREHLPAPVSLEPLLGVQIRLEHPLVEQHVSHGLGYDHVHLLGKLDLLDLARYDPDDVLDLVGLDQLLGVLGDAGTLDGVDLRVFFKVWVKRGVFSRYLNAHL